jgi:hypothetical protein
VPLAAAAVVTIATALAAGGAAGAAPSLDDVGAALRGDPVYVDEAAERALTAEEADDLRDAIAEGDTPIFVAVLPASAADAVGGDPGQLPEALAVATQLGGTYAVLAGDSFRAGSSTMPAGTAGELATASFQAARDEGAAAVLTEFVGRVQDAAAAGPAAGGGGEADADDDGGIGFGGVLLVAGAGAVGLYAWTRARKRRAAREAEDREHEADRQLLLAEVSVLADDVVSLEPEVAIHPDAQADYDAAVSRYKVAHTALTEDGDGRGHRFDLVRVRRLVDEARYAMARARARIAGREPPPPPDELRRPGDHDEPVVDVDERGEPVYVGRDGFTGYGPFYGGGWFMGGNGLFTGLLLGSLLGGWGHPGPIVIDHGDSGGGGEGGGDWGGDFGGDFGGGDFGGGDFGGGDFG